MKYERETLQDLLRTGVQYVKFTKKNGDVRVMKSTLNFDLIPQEFHPKGTDGGAASERMVRNNILAVFDLEKMAWRSFGLDSVTDVSESPFNDQEV